MARKSLGYVHLEWTCPYCETRNIGTAKKCVSCGAPQPEDVQFEQAAEEKIITNEAEIAKAKAGPDIHCAYCGTRNPAGNSACLQCGADLSEGAQRQSGQALGAHRDKPAADVTCQYCGAENPATARQCSQCGASLAPKPKTPPPAKKPKKQSKTPLILGAIVALFLVTCCAFIALSMRTEDHTAAVQNIEWERKIAIEALRETNQSDWRDEIPGDAISIGSCTQREHHRSPNPPGEEVCGAPYTIDTGSGAGEVVQDCEYIVYKDWCEYTVMTWQQVDTATANGNDFNPYWPQFTLSRNEREGSRSEVYTVYFRGDGDSYTYQADDLNEYKRFTPGTEWILKVNTFGAVNDVEAP